jgi:hypothetical protein
VVRVEQWAELRRLQFVGGVSIRELQRRTGCTGRRSGGRCAETSRGGIGVASGRPSSIRSSRRSGGCCARTRGCRRVRVLELICELGFGGGKTLVYEYVADLRPLRRRVHARFSERLPPRRGVAVRSLAARPGGAGRARPDAARLGGCGGAGVLACRRGRTDLGYALGSAPRPARPKPPRWVTFRAEQTGQFSNRLDRRCSEARSPLPRKG